MRTLIALFISSPLLAFAAPYPATSTSALTAPEKGLYFMHKGFTLKTEGSTWTTVATSEDSLLDTIRFADKNNPDAASLSVRTDRVAKNASLDLYTRKWMRDYPSYGFEVLATKQFNLNGNQALIVDMLSRAKNKQIRQVVLKNDDKVAIMTCLDSKDTFSKSLQQCNQIIKTFSWVTPEEKPSLKK
ncbi:hypothetical protein [Bdellovibrio sp. HCB209]|uniref:hypothetical protein n=1 Tax=Bdellovibrio sp. HCB209 TaxID=3394354 RepID=UPI0039B551E5